MRHLHACAIAIMLLSSATACRKAEEDIKKPVDASDNEHKYCKSWRLYSVMRSIEHGNFNNLVFDARDSITVIYSGGRISSILLHNSSKNGQGAWTTRTGQTNFTYVGDKICYSAGGITDTITVDNAMHMLRHSSYNPDAGCGTPFYEIITYEYANGLPTTATTIQYADGILSMNYVQQYAFNNGDLIPQKGNGTPNYDPDRRFPLDFIPFGDLQYAGAFVFHNVHLLNSAFDSTNNNQGTYSYRFDNSGKIIQTVSLLHYDVYGMRTTDDYYYECAD